MLNQNQSVRLLASDFPSENPRTQNSTILILTVSYNLKNQFLRKNNLAFLRRNLKTKSNKTYKKKQFDYEKKYEIIKNVITQTLKII